MMLRRKGRGGDNHNLILQNNNRDMTEFAIRLNLQSKKATNVRKINQKKRIKITGNSPKDA